MPCVNRSCRSNHDWLASPQHVRSGSTKFAACRWPAGVAETCAEIPVPTVLLRSSSHIRRGIAGTVQLLASAAGADLAAEPALHRVGRCALGHRPAPHAQRRGAKSAPPSISPLVPHLYTLLISSISFPASYLSYPHLSFLFSDLTLMLDLPASTLSHLSVSFPFS